MQSFQRQEKRLYKNNGLSLYALLLRAVHYEKINRSFLQKIRQFFKPTADQKQLREVRLRLLKYKVATKADLKRIKQTEVGKL